MVRVGGLKRLQSDLERVMVHSSTIDQLINLTSGKWPNTPVYVHAGVITQDMYEARKAERQRKPDWKDAPEWAQWLAQDGNGYWIWYQAKPLKSFASYWRIASGRYQPALTGEVFGDWRDTLEQRPNHIVEPDEKVDPELKFAGLIKDVYPHQAAAIYCKWAQSAIDKAELEEAAKACERALDEFFPEAKLPDWYDYETMEMRKNALPGAGEVCECFDFERSEFVRVKVLDAFTGSREAAVATININGDSFGYVYWGCKFRPLDWDRNLQPKPEQKPSPELSFHLSTAFNELQASARLLPEDDPRKQMLVSLANGVSAVREGV